MYDLVGGGFHRYSVDERWLVPHFEKMLYDNALLAPAYLHAWLVTGEERYREVAEQTVDYMLRELALPEGGFASAQDADTDGVEGLTYTWTEEEGVPAELLQPFEHGRSIIRGELEPELSARLLDERDAPPAAGRDDKAIASWNGLALAALAEAGRRLDRDDLLARRAPARRVPARAAVGPGRPAPPELARRPRERPGYLDDYADVAHGLYELHVATGELRWLEESQPARAARGRAVRRRRARRLLPGRADGEQLVARKKDLDDNPTPSGNSMLAYVLLRLARIYGDDELERRAVGVLRLVHRGLDARAVRVRLGAVRPRPVPGAAARDRDHRRARTTRSPAPRSRRSTRTPSSPSARATTCRCSPASAASTGRPAVYVCERFACQAPVTDPALL